MESVKQNGLWKLKEMIDKVLENQTKKKKIQTHREVEKILSWQTLI